MLVQEILGGVVTTSNDECLFCGRSALDSAAEITLVDRRKGLPGTWNLYKCAECRVIQIKPMPDADTLEKYYSAYSKDENVSFSVRQGSRFPAIRKIFHHLSGDVDPRDFIDVPSGARVLDYGCGLAGYLSDFHNRGVSISGAEIADYVVAACQSQGLDVYHVDDFSRIPFSDEEFNIVYLMQVFEHLREPHAAMAELARVLKPGGDLYLAVPNASSVWRKLFKSNWVSGWFAPFHLYHYNRDILADLAAQHGFEVLKCWSTTPESWFRLNLKACLYPQESELDWRQSWVDSRPVRYILMLMLRLAELPFAERDCLAIRMRKK